MKALSYFLIFFILVCIANIGAAKEFKEQSGQTAICAWSAKYVIEIPDFQKQFGGITSIKEIKVTNFHSSPSLFGGFSIQADCEGYVESGLIFKDRKKIEWMLWRQISADWFGNITKDVCAICMKTNANRQWIKRTCTQSPFDKKRQICTGGYYYYYIPNEAFDRSKTPSYCVLVKFE